MRIHIIPVSIVCIMTLGTPVFASQDNLFAGNTTTFGAIQQTLISGEIENGGYGAPVIKIATVNGETGVFVGGQGAWIVNHCFALGGGGYGLATRHDVPDEALKTYTLPDGSPRDLELGLGYGGIIIEYFHSPNSLTHITIDSLFGAGGIVYTEDYGDKDYDSDTWDVSDSFFVFEPGIKAEINVTYWLRINAGISYMMVTGLDMEGLEDDDIGGVTGNLAFRFGSF